MKELVEENTRKALEVFQNSLQDYIFAEWEYDIEGSAEQPILVIKPVIEQLSDTVRTCKLELALWEQEPRVIVEHDPIKTVEMTELELFKQSLVSCLVELRVVLHEVQEAQFQFDEITAELHKTETIFKEVDKLLKSRNDASGV